MILFTLFLFWSVNWNEFSSPSQVGFQDKKTKTATGSETVYITRTGKRYHRSGCRYLLSRIETDVRAAQSAGYTPCKVCRPPADGLKKQAPSSSNAASGGRCRATTKKGTRCKRSASSGGYCWQH